MAAESPIRIVEASGKWAACKDSVVLAPSCAVTAEEMTFLLNGHRFHGSGKGAAPNRSGSAPPSMEGSLAVIENLVPQKSFKVDSSSKSLNSSIDKCGVDPLHDDQSFPVYNSSSAILNSRLHPRLRSQEDQHLVHQVEGFGNKRRSYLDDDGNGSFHLLSHGILSAHKEESKDDQSPGQQSDDLPDKSSRFLSGQKGTVGQKNFDGLMQVSRQSLSLSYASAEEAAHSDAGPSCLQDISVRISNAATHGGAMDSKGLSFTCDPSTAQLSTSHLNFLTGALPLLPLPSCKSNRSEVHFTTEASVSDTDYSSTANIESEMKALNISGFQKMENPKCQKERNHICENNLQYHPAYQHQISMCQVQGVNNQLVSQGKNQACLGLGQYQHGPSKFLADAQPVFHSFGFMPPLYPTAAAFMTPTNPFCPSIVPIPPLTLGAYALNTTNCSSFIAGYPSPSDIHLPYDDTPGQGFNAGTSAVSSRGSFAHGVDMQQLNKSCGQWGLAFEPSFVDPLQTQYFQHPLWNVYSIPGQVVLQGSRGDAYRSQMSGTDAQKCYDVAAYSDEWMFQNQKIGGLGILNPRSGIMGLNFFGCPTNISMMMQLSSSSLPTPVLPGSSVDGISLSGRNNDMSFSSASGRNMGTCGARDGWKGYKSFDYPKANSFLEELKSGKGRTLELCDIVGHVVEFSADQHGSRFIQQKLEICSAEEKAFVFKEVLPHTSKLVTDVFGNYVIQKYLEYGSAEQREELAMEFAGQVLPLSLQMYGCRVIQKALEVIDVEQMTKLVCELDGHVLRCVRDQNGNHVIQKCIECIPVGNIQFVIAAFRGQVAILSTHPYGCRVIQRILEYCMDDLQSQFIVDEILQSAYTLAHDQYGNYVTQHVLEKGKPYERSQIIRKLSGHFVHLSQHKFASNVVEKCLEHGDTFEQELLIQEIIGHDEGNDKLLAMMKDQFANYVVQKILAKCTDAQRDTLLNRIKVHAQSLKKYTYGKHIIARLDQFELFGEEIQTLGS